MAKEKENNNNKHFMKDFKAELKKVVWPTSKQMVNNVSAVIVIVLITAAIVFVLDFVFLNMNEYGVNKLKTHIQSKQQSQVINNNETNEQSNTENSDNTENNEQVNNQNTENNTSEQ